MQLSINSYLRAVAPLGRESDHIGPFVATCSPTTDNPYLNYAIPDDRAAPTRDEIQALVDWYLSRSRKPRLEYVTSESPAVEPALLGADFAIEGRLPVMVWDRDAPATPPPDGIEFVVPMSDEDLFGLMEVTAEAYDSPPPAAYDVKLTRWSLGHGTGAVVARDEATGKVVAAGTFPPIVEGVTEIAAIGVALAHRRRGVGQALARRLAEEACARGASRPFLMAAHEPEARIYLRAGFVVVGEILHISR